LLRIAASVTIIPDTKEGRMGRETTVATRAGELILDVDRSAVIVVDMQNDFVSQGGMFDQNGVPTAGVRTVVPTIRRVLDAARDAGIPIVYLKMGYRPDLSDLGEEGSVNRDRHLAFGVGQSAMAPDGTESRNLIRETWGTDIVDELTPQAGDTVIYKHRFSGFYETGLHEALQRLNVRDLIFTGCTTSICVDSTIRDAMFRDYRALVLQDCMAEPIGSDAERTNHEATLLTLQTLFGWVGSSTELLAALPTEARTTT
jgi:ureidoacrylate peracid hydrolase